MQVKTKEFVSEIGFLGVKTGEEHSPVPKAMQFASELGPKRVINISHAYNSGQCSVMVWYWDEDETEAAHKWS